jgi:hypothetical protein
VILWLACAGAGTPDASCPPEGPFGRAPGDAAEDIALTDCAGDAVTLRGLCGTPAVIGSWYGWCPSCESHAALIRRLADAHPELAAAVVLNEDPLGAPMDGDFCSMYAETYPSAAAVWMDPDDRLEAYGTTDFVLVLSADGVIEFARETASEDTIEAAVLAAL